MTARRRAAAGLALCLVASAAPAAEPNAAASADARRSGYHHMGRSTQALQDDDAQNPAMLWVQAGREAWQQPPAAGGRACAGCHGPLERAMQGVAARYPVIEADGTVRPLGQRINQCRTLRQGQPPWPAESEPLLGVEAALALASRGAPLAPPSSAADPAARAAAGRGEALFRQRLGQLNLSCAQCHDEHAGGRLGGSVIPQGHPTGYPIYRLEWQTLGSLQRRLRNCLVGMRAEPFADDDPAWAELELYLKQRAAGMAMDAPAVRP